MQPSEMPDTYLARSPITPIKDHVASSILNIAPERAHEVTDLLKQHQIALVLDDRAGFVFTAGPSEHGNQIRASVQGLELLWALSFAYYVLYQEWKRNPAAAELDLSASSRTRGAAALLQWALENNVGGRRVMWPDDLPHPEVASAGVRAGGEPRDEVVATELFLCASAWILHHELAHLRLQHPLVTTDSVAEEREADQAATAWILDSLPEEPHRLKRGLGIAVAVVALAVLKLERPTMSSGGLPQTHPGVAERLFDALDHSAFGEDHQVFDFVVHSLKLHFDHVGVEAGGEFDTARDCFHEYCMILHRLHR